MDLFVLVMNFSRCYKVDVLINKWMSSLELWLILIWWTPIRGLATTDCTPHVDFIHVYFCEATDSMQYRRPNTNLDSGCQTVSIVTGDNGCRHLSVVAPDKSLLLRFWQSRPRECMASYINILLLLVVSHLARSDNPNITWVVWRLARSDTPNIVLMPWAPADQSLRTRAHLMGAA